MRSLTMLCFLMVAVYSETVNEESVPNLTDFHLFLDDLRAKFKQQKASDPWKAFQEAEKSLVKAIDMGDALTEAGDIAPSEVGDMMLYEVRHIVLGLPQSTPQLIKWEMDMCKYGEVPFTVGVKNPHSKIIEQLNLDVVYGCEELRTGGDLYE